MRRSEHSHHTHEAEHEHDGSLSDLLGRCGRYYAHRIGCSHRGQENVLRWLAEHPDVTQKELGEGLDITPASLSELLMKLERKGYIERFKDAQDRRFVRVCLTEDGTEAARAQKNGGDPFVALTPEEQEQLKALLAKLLESWETQLSGGHGRRSCRSDGERDHSHCGGEHPGHSREHGSQETGRHGH